MDDMMMEEKEQYHHGTNPWLEIGKLYKMEYVSHFGSETEEMHYRINIWDWGMNETTKQLILRPMHLIDLRTEVAMYLGSEMISNHFQSSWTYKKSILFRKVLIRDQVLYATDDKFFLSQYSTVFTFRPINKKQNG